MFLTPISTLASARLPGDDDGHFSFIPEQIPFELPDPDEWIPEQIPAETSSSHQWMVKCELDGESYSEYVLYGGHICRDGEWVRECELNDEICPEYVLYEGYICRGGEWKKNL